MKRTVESKAFALVEMVVVLAGVTIILLLLFAVVTQGRQKSGRIKCVNNLKQLGLAARVFASANMGLYPGELLASTNANGLTAGRYFASLERELGTPAIVVCPEDRRRVATNRFTALGSGTVSYFGSLSANELKPFDFLFGDDHLQVGTNETPSGLLTISSNTPLSWTSERHQGQGNIALADGSVQQFQNARLAAYVGTLVTTNVLIFP